jgi:S1-C subfamily serine protease
MTAFLVKKNNSNIGFRVTGISKSSYIYGIGIRNNDVITGVNGYSLANVDDVLKAVAAFQFSRQFRLEIKRSGKTMYIYYKISDF